MRHEILGNGGFTELSMHGKWRFDERTYLAAVHRYATEIGHLDWAAPMDWMTENNVLARTGASLQTHQRRTVDNFLRLRDLGPELPIIPVLQGQSVDDYQRCADMYEQHGIDLSARRWSASAACAAARPPQKSRTSCGPCRHAVSDYMPSAPRCSASTATPT